MGNMKCTRTPKIILVPYPAQGHVTPMLKLASTLARRGFDPVMIIPEFIHQRIMASTNPKTTKIEFTSIPDGLKMDVPRDFFSIEKAMEKTMPTHLERLLGKFDEDGQPVACLIVDLLASWAIEVGQRCRVPVAGFWPAMLATFKLISAIPDMVRNGLISEDGNPQHQGPICFLPNQQLMLSPGDLPWLIGSPASRNARFQFWRRTLSRSRNLPWLLVNSFPEECPDHNEAYKPRHDDDHHHHKPLIVQVGSLSEHARVKNPSLWDEDMSCLKWLDKQKPGSVMYISFGSWVSPIGEEKVRSLALALEAMKQSFLWVLGPNWRDGLPSGFLDRASKQGKVVSWAPQVKVLKHKAVGCFLTHCGWNSTMEAIRCKKRLLCYPVAGDQFLNYVYIVEKWKIGGRLNGFERKEVEEGWRKVMNDDGMNHRLMKLQEMTMGEEANSRMVSRLTCFLDDLEKMMLRDDLCSELLNIVNPFGI
ncbi:hypothetical protein Tsubulata_005184 [Turnera subulata]|uniref:Glycosyltransferase n=1 Tax=Turnera subulata TaxID=218843 RepID=A0A9Q0GBJ7_9ROSI|nr:hypothetical protein Tsubulata_005184 [Turnera subulata]